LVLAEEPSEQVASLDDGGYLDGFSACRPGAARVGRSQEKGAMGTMLVV
jgi:hypothetical protein